VITHRRFVLRRYSATTVEQPTLVQFLILSMLLHLLVVVLFGNTTGSGERRDEYGFGGSLDVTLRRLSPEPGPGLRLAPGAEESSPGRALLRRSAGTTDAPTARPRVENVPAAESARTPEARRIEHPPESTEAAQPAQEAPPPAQPMPVETLPRLNLDAPEEVDKPYTPSAISPAPKERAPVPPVALPPGEAQPAPEPPAEQIAPPKIEREVAPPVELRPREVPIAPTAPLERISPPATPQKVAPPVELKPREVPIAPAAQVERIAPPKIEPEPLVQPVELTPREVPITQPAPVEPIAPPKVEREVARPVELTPREVPITPPAPVERIAPPKIEREVAPPVEVPAPRQAPAETIAPAERVTPPVPERETVPAAPALPRAVPGETTPRVERAAPPALAPDKPLATSPPASPGISPAPPPTRFHFGSPTPEDEVFRPRADAVSPLSEPESQPYVDLEGARRQARKLATEGSGSRALVPFPLPVPPPPDRQSKEARALEKAIKPDCRDAYAGLGLLAIPMLAASAIGDVGCRW
jgi:hypothetical protein